MRIDAAAPSRHAVAMTQPLLIGAALAVALLLGWMAWDGWFYLQRGYWLGVSMDGGPSSAYHIEFPVWRSVAHLVFWGAATAAVVAYIARHRLAPALAWTAFAATLIVGMSDISQYGTMGSPTSGKTVLLLLLFALFTKLSPLPARAGA